MNALAQKLAALALTVVASATLAAGALAPAQVAGSAAPVAHTARTVA